MATPRRQSTITNKTGERLSPRQVKICRRTECEAWCDINCSSRVPLGATLFGHDRFWPTAFHDLVWSRPGLATTWFGHDLVWPRPSLAKTKFGQDQVRDNQYSPCFWRQKSAPSSGFGLHFLVSELHEVAKSVCLLTHQHKRPFMKMYTHVRTGGEMSTRRAQTHNVLCLSALHPLSFQRVKPQVRLNVCQRVGPLWSISGPLPLK